MREQASQDSKEEVSMFWDIMIIVFSVSIVLGVIVKAIVDKKKGKGGCSGCPFSGDCSSCHTCSTKTSHPTKRAEEKN